MSFKEIKELRQAGQLDEALEMANQALEADPDNIWNKRAAAWVYYDMLKMNTAPDNYDAFKENLFKIKELALPENEKMVFDNCAWQIGSMVFNLQKSQTVDYQKINDVFGGIKDFNFTKPSESYSFMYKAFHKGYQNWPQYLNFADWWNFENFLPGDYAREEYNGRKIMSMGEQAYIAYSKKLLEITSLAQSEAQLNEYKDKMASFLPQLDRIIVEHTDYQYPPYFKAKLLLAMGSEDNVLSAFLPFAIQKRNDFWVWELLADIFSSDTKKQFACYCKALSLRSPEDFIVKLRQTFAAILIEKKMYNEAKTEINLVLATRKRNNWKITDQLVHWTESDWYKSATQNKDNRSLYSKFQSAAEEILFQDVPEETIVVEFVNENKRILNFVKNRTMHGFLNYSGYLKKPQVGDLISVRFSGEGKNGRYKIISAKQLDGNTNSDAIKDYEGNLNIIPNKGFGFLAETFFSPEFIRNNNITNGSFVKGKAILSFNKKKNEWGWKAISVFRP